MNKLKLLIVTKSYPAAGIEILKDKFIIKFANFKSKGDVCKEIKGAFGLFCDPNIVIDKEVLDAAGDGLKVVSTISVGYDHLDIEEIKSRGIRVGYSPHTFTEATAEMAVALALAVGRNVVEANKQVLSGNWESTKCSHGFDQSTVGIIGLGRIGLSVSKKLIPFNIHRLLYTSRKEKPEAKQLGAIYTDIDTLVAECDYIILTLQLNEETRHIINRERISAMKPEAVIVNVGRGGLIDQDALVEALQNNKITGAGLDVTTPEPLPKDHPLLRLNNVVIVPHVAGNVHRARNSTYEVAAKNILAVLEGTEMPYEL